MEEELGGAVCEYCGDAGGARAMLLCENSFLGCIGGRHLYCWLPVKRELAEDFYCDMCCGHRTREAAAKARAEEAAAAAAAVEVAHLPPPKRQRFLTTPAASQGAAPQRAGPISRPAAAAASRGTLSLALEGIEDDVVRRNSVIDGGYRYQHGIRELPSLSEYSLPRIVAGGELWSGSLALPITIVSFTSHP